MTTHPHKPATAVAPVAAVVVPPAPSGHGAGEGPGTPALSPEVHGVPGRPQGRGGAAHTSPAASPLGLQKAAAAMSEDALEQAMLRIVWDLRKMSRRILAYHPWKEHTRRAAEGWPDWVLLGDGGLLFRELKRQKESPAKAQQEWLDMLQVAGVDADVWRPSDLLSGRIAQELAAITAPPRSAA